MQTGGGVAGAGGSLLILFAGRQPGRAKWDDDSIASGRSSPACHWFGGREASGDAGAAQRVGDLILERARPLPDLAAPEKWLGAALGFVGYDISGDGSESSRKGTTGPCSALAAYSGAGGDDQPQAPNWARGQGFGMGQVVGLSRRRSAGRRVKLAHTGSVFRRTPRTQAWRDCWRDRRSTSGGLISGALLGMARPRSSRAIFGTRQELRDSKHAAAWTTPWRRAGPLPARHRVMSVWVLFKTQLDIWRDGARQDRLLGAGAAACARARGRRTGDYRGPPAVVSGSARAAPAPIGLSLGQRGESTSSSAAHLLRINNTSCRPSCDRRLEPPGLVATAIF